MATIYSTRFADGRLNATSLNVYTVPSGFVAVVVDISLFVAGSGASTTVLRSGALGGMVHFTAPAANAYSHTTGRWVLNAGESLEVTTTDTAGQYSISGYLLEGP